MSEPIITPIKQLSHLPRGKLREVTPDNIPANFGHAYFYVEPTTGRAKWFIEEIEHENLPEPNQ